MPFAPKAARSRFDICLTNNQFRTLDYTSLFTGVIPHPLLISCYTFGTRTQKSHQKLMLSMTRMAGVTGLEPAASGVTGRRSNQLSYTPIFKTAVSDTGTRATRKGDCVVKQGRQTVKHVHPCYRKKKLNDPMPSKRMGMQRVNPHEHVTARGITTAVWQQGLRGRKWWVVRGSNPRPTRCK